MHVEICSCMYNTNGYVGIYLVAAGLRTQLNPLNKKLHQVTLNDFQSMTLTPLEFRIVCHDVDACGDVFCMIYFVTSVCYLNSL